MNQTALRAYPTPAEGKDFADAVARGMAARPFSIPARYFYDAEGSALFDRITELPEYYPTRIELGLLTAHAAEIAALVGPGRAVVEFGAGSAVKTPALLRACAPAAYVPIDLAETALTAAVARLRTAFPALPVWPVVADFTLCAALPRAVAHLPRLGFFPGSTIGNFAHPAAVDLLRGLRAGLGDEALLLIGLDAEKPEEVLLAAYDDEAGVTAAFNRNLLRRLNRELQGTVPVEAFAHEARWNAALSRIEMHLRATRDVAFCIGGRMHAMAAGETIHTENSCKYSAEAARVLALAAGWQRVRRFEDARGWYGLELWRAVPDAVQP